jgi:hypothetical protein
MSIFLLRKGAKVQKIFKHWMPLTVGNAAANKLVLLSSGYELHKII